MPAKKYPYLLSKQYSYILPPSLIAQKPAEPRDSARLLVYDKTKKTVKYGIFKNLSQYLPKNAVLVLNQTKVLPARLFARKSTGGQVNLLYTGKSGQYLKFLANTALKPNSILKIAGSPENTKAAKTPLKLPFRRGKTGQITMKIVKKSDSEYFLKPSFSTANLHSFLSHYGQTPLPPYIKNSPLTEKQKQSAYQAVFAKNGESVAAPTASLHFTRQLLNSIKKRGIEAQFLRLDVSLGTFAPLSKENLQTGKLHTEYYNIPAHTAQFLKQAKRQKRPIIAVGTTTVRALETWAKTKKTSGLTDIFIRPPYKFQTVDGLITNFHVPQSSLLMLVASLTGRKQLLKLYQSAIKKKFRFYSFGDAMLIS